MATKTKGKTKPKKCGDGYVWGKIKSDKPTPVTKVKYGCIPKPKRGETGAIIEGPGETPKPHTPSKK